MDGDPIIRQAVRVLLLDENDRLLLFRAEDPANGSVFWFPAGGGVEEGEDAQSAATREIAEETGLTDLQLGPELWHRRHVFTWRGVELDQRERWFENNRQSINASQMFALGDNASLQCDSVRPLRVDAVM
jgi:8-oxo-dGTP pyrophosphatase MutT (NUDIX family)